MSEAKTIVKLAVKALEEKKAENIKIIKIDKLSVIADYFIIANGTNPSQMDAMVSEVTDQLQKENIHAARVEGANTSGWVLMDYRDVVIHIFSKQERLFYDLERIWKDGTLVDAASL